MRVTLIIATLFSVGHSELCTSKFSIDPSSSIASHDALDVSIQQNQATVSYDSNTFTSETEVLNLLKTLTNSAVTSLHNSTCDSCDLCDYCTYDPVYDNTYGTGGAHHNFLCSDATNCQGCDLVQSYIADACDRDEPVNSLFSSNVAFLAWDKTFKESCPHKCAEQFECTLRCPHSQHTVNLHILLDDKPSETYWQMFHNDTSVVMAQGGYYTDVNARQSIHATSCVESGCYGFTLVDSGYNGMRTGSYRVNVDGTDIISETGDFNFSQVETFCTRKPEAPPRADSSPPPAGGTLLGSPPPPGSNQIYSVGFSFVASGSVADFDANRISALKVKCSETTGVPVANISMQVTAASVQIVTTFSVTGLDPARQLESTLIDNTRSLQAIDTLFGGEVTSESVTSSVTFEQVESYCTCKSEWTYPCTDGVTRNGCDLNSCGAQSHALYCPATDATCTPDPQLQNSAMEAVQNTGSEFVFWCSPSCVDDANGDIQEQGWGSTAASACDNLVKGLQSSHSKTFEETCSTDLSSGMGVLVKHYCPVACENVSPLCPNAPPPPGAGAIESSPPPSTTTASSPPPAVSSPQSPPASGDDENSDDSGSNTALLVVAIVLGVLVVLGGAAIAVRRYTSRESADADVSSAPNATVATNAPKPTVTSATIPVVSIEMATSRSVVRSVARNMTQAKYTPGPSPEQSGPSPKPTTQLPLRPAPTLPAPTSLPAPSSVPAQLQSSVNQMLVPSRRSPRRSRSQSPRRG